MNWKQLCLVFVCAGFLAVGCGDDNPSDPGDGDGNGNGGNTPTTTPPREWQGTWVGTVTTTDNAGSKWLATADTTESDTLAICDKGFADLEAPFGCITFIGDDSLYIDCDTMFTEDSCTASFTIHGYGKRTGTSFTLMGTETGSAVGSGCDVDDDENYDRTVMATYTRVNSAVPECGEGFPEDTTDNGGGNVGEFVGIGDYEARVRVWFCGDNNPISDTRDTSSICPSDSLEDFEDGFEGSGIECDIDVGQNTISVTCEGEVADVETGCTITTSNSYNGTYDDDSYDMTGGGTITVSGSGEFCDFIPNQCFEFEVNGRRLSSTPSDCPDGKVSPEAAAGLNPEVIAAIVKSKVEAALRDAADQSR